MNRLTHRNYNGMVYVPGYAPRCDDPKTCELIVLLANRLSELEDMIYNGISNQETTEALITKKEK